MRSPRRKPLHPSVRRGCRWGVVSCEIFPDLGYHAWEDFRTCGLRLIQQKKLKESNRLCGIFHAFNVEVSKVRRLAPITSVEKRGLPRLCPLPMDAASGARQRISAETCRVLSSREAKRLHLGLPTRWVGTTTRFASSKKLRDALDWERFQVAIVDGSGPEGDAENKPLMNQESLRRMVFLSGEAERSRVFLYEVAGSCPCMLLLASVFRRSVGRTL